MCARRPPGGAHGPVPENLLDARPRLPLNQIKWVLFTVPTELTKIARVSPMPVTILGRRAGSGGIWLPGQKLPVSPPEQRPRHSVRWGAWLGRAAPGHSLLGPREHPLSREARAQCLPVLGTDDGGPESAMPHAPARG